ncbi:DinB family protein [Paracoccaceae bacterium]|nr:DinB family protein [Paracoccaceae bacterium]
MITPQFCEQMARYNSWQNTNIRSSLSACSHQVLTAERGAYFGSILGTLNHLLWGDQIWMSRFDNGEGPRASVDQSSELTKTFRDWKEEREKLDRRIIGWVCDLTQITLEEELTWFSRVYQKEIRINKSLAIVHMFNHQTHHRGQIHSMMTAIGIETLPTDIIAMP